MTRIAIIADVHGDVEALRDALVQIDRLGCDEILCAGDLVGYGVFPEEVITLIRERRISCVRGNHDCWAIGDGTPEDPTGGNHPHDGSGWDLSRDARRFLRSLPRVWRKTINGMRVVVVHGSIRDEMDALIADVVTGKQVRQRLDDAEADVLVTGHVHDAFHLVAPGGGIVVSAGAVYRRPVEEVAKPLMIFDTKRDKFVAVPRSSGGTFAVLELPSRKFTVRRAEDGSVVRITMVSKR